MKGVLSHFFIAILTQVGIGYQYLRHAIDNAVASFGTALGRGKVDEEKSFLQAVKLQISRSFKLVPYERLAFHRIIGILRTDVGMGILLKDLDAAPDIRRSAIEVLSRFNQPQALAGLAACLKREITDEEKLAILECIKAKGGIDYARELMAFIDTAREKGRPDVVERAFDALGTVGAGSEEVRRYLVEIIESDRLDRHLKACAIEALVSFKPVSLLESILKKDDDEFAYRVYRVIYGIAVRLLDEESAKRSEDDRIYTYVPGSEDKLMLELRVLLGKMTNAFDKYSNKTKVAFVCAMMASHHREYLTYVMKALTSGDTELVGMMLFAVYQNVDRLSDQEKLFNSLIAFSTEVERFNEIIVDIFVRFFGTTLDSMAFNVMRNKLYGNIVVTLGNYFETYRKEFMITDVIERDLPESFQRIRRFILSTCTPDLKKEIIAFLTKDDPALVKHIITSMGRHLSHVEENQLDDLTLFIEMLMDRDRKSRENSAARIEDLNFEKLYLRNRIIRLCRIIENLKIETAASHLVNIYNYLKKYPDRDIMEATEHALSTLNYSYMLGEIEVMLNTGTEEEQLEAIKLISLFTEQRSLNILLEFLKTHIASLPPVVEPILAILIERDIAGNITANQLFKAVIEHASSPSMRDLAVLGIGACGFETDVEYLNSLFGRFSQEGSTKAVIIRAMAAIMAGTHGINRVQFVRYMQEYLKDPDIRVRIYSCIMLARLESEDAIRLLRDMLVIKNRTIQRDILTMLGEFKSLEFAFFLLSLLKEEYGISRDIVSLIEKLPVDQIREIDAFIINIFRKYEAPQLDVFQNQPKPIPPQSEYLVKRQKSILNIILRREGIMTAAGGTSGTIHLNLLVKSLLLAAIQDNGGVINSMTGDYLVAHFEDPGSAAFAAMAISNAVGSYNKTRVAQRRLALIMQIVTGPACMTGDEIMLYPQGMVSEIADLPVLNQVLIDKATATVVAEAFSLRELPQISPAVSGLTERFFEIIAPINFMKLSEEIIKRLREEEEKRDLMQRQIEEEIKKVKRERRTATSVEIARGLDDLAQKLQAQLEEIDRYVQKRSTDRELIKNVRRMLMNVHNLYKVEISRLIID